MHPRIFVKIFYKTFFIFFLIISRLVQVVKSTKFIFCCKYIFLHKFRILAPARSTFLWVNNTAFKNFWNVSSRRCIDWKCTFTHRDVLLSLHIQHSINFIRQILLFPALSNRKFGYEQWKSGLHRKLQKTVRKLFILCVRMCAPYQLDRSDHF